MENLVLTSLIWKGEKVIIVPDSPGAIMVVWKLFVLSHGFWHQYLQCHIQVSHLIIAISTSASLDFNAKSCLFSVNSLTWFLFGLCCGRVLFDHTLPSTLVLLLCIKDTKKSVKVTFTFITEGSIKVYLEQFTWNFWVLSKCDSVVISILLYSVAILIYILVTSKQILVKMGVNETS